MPTNNNNNNNDNSSKGKSNKATNKGGRRKSRGNGNKDNNNKDESSSRWNKPFSPSCPTTRTNMKRCQEMIACRQEIAALQSKLDKMKQEQERMGRLAALQTCKSSSMAAYLWSQCAGSANKDERWNKPIVLALLKCPLKSKSPNTSAAATTTTTTSNSSSTTMHIHLPVPFRLHKWDKKVPRHLREDRDVVLARLQREDLFCGIPSTLTAASATTSSSCATALLTIPPRLQKDLHVVLAAVRRYPDILVLPQKQTRSKQQQQHQQQQPPPPPQPSLLEQHANSHVEILQALLEAFRNLSENPNSNMIHTTTSRQDFLDLFSCNDDDNDSSSSNNIRNDGSIMMQVWNEWVLPGFVHVNETLFGPVLRNDKAFALQLATCAQTNNDKSNKSNNFPANALCALSKTFRADRDVVLAFVSCNGQNLEFVASGLKKTWQVVKTASLENPSVLGALSPHVKKRLQWKKPFMLQLFSRIHERHNNNSSNKNAKETASAAATAEMVWEYCTPKLRKDRDVFMAALRAGAGMQLLQSFSDLTTTTTTTTASAPSPTTTCKKKTGKQRQQGCNSNHNNHHNNNTIPSFLVEQRDLWIDLICSGHLSWHELPKTYRRDKEFAIHCLLQGNNNGYAVQEVNNNSATTRTSTRRQQQQQQQQQNHDASSCTRTCRNTNAFLGMEMVQTILEHCPSVATDARMVVSWIQHYHAAVCSCSSTSFFYATNTTTPVVMSYQVLCPCLDIYLEALPLSIRRDKSIMLEACRVNPAVILYLPVPLQEDRDVMECVLLYSSSSTLSSPSSSLKRGQRPLASLQYVSPMAQHLYPDLVAQAIRQLPKPPSLTDDDDDGDYNINGFDDDLEESGDFEWSIWDIFDDIDEDLWINREIALAWIARGGAYLHDDFPEDFDNDAELFLEIAASPNNWDDFMFASETLLTDKEFMTKAVQRNGRVLKEAKKGLDRDYDLALIAFANTENLVNRYNWTCPDLAAGSTRAAAKNEDFLFLTDFAKHVRTELMCHESFVEFLLCVQLSTPATPRTTSSTTNSEDQNNNRRRNGNGNRRYGSGDRSGKDAGSGRGNHHRRKQKQTAAHLLAQGAETTVAFTKLVGAYLGIPTGERLRLLRQASANLARWGF